MGFHIGRNSLLTGVFRTSLTDMARAKAKLPRNARGTPPLLPDEQILEMRALHEFANWDRVRLARRYGVDDQTVKRYLDGITRAKLCARPCHLPEGVAAK